MVSFRVRKTLPRIPKADQVYLNLFVFNLIYPLLRTLSHIILNVCHFVKSAKCQSNSWSFHSLHDSHFGWASFLLCVFSSTDFRKDASYWRGCGAAGAEPSHNWHREWGRTKKKKNNMRNTNVQSSLHDSVRTSAYRCKYCVTVYSRRVQWRSSLWKWCPIHLRETQWNLRRWVLIKAAGYFINWLSRECFY